MTDVAELLEQVAEQARAQARPPALAVLRRRRARRTAARTGVGMTALAGIAAVAVLVPWGPAPAEDVVVTDAAPTASPASAVPSVPVPAGQVALPEWVADLMRLPAGAPAVADEAWRLPTEDGPLVTAVRRDGERLCWAVFTEGDLAAPSGGSSCDSVVALPAYRSAGLDLGAATEGTKDGGPADWLVLTGSAPAGTRTVVLTASGGEQERVTVASAGPAYLERAFFAVPWVREDTVVEALDGAGRRLARGELLLGMGTPG